MSITDSLGNSRNHNTIPFLQINKVQEKYLSV